MYHPKTFLQKFVNVIKNLSMGSGSTDRESNSDHMKMKVLVLGLIC